MTLTLPLWLGVLLVATYSVHALSRVAEVLAEWRLGRLKLRRAEADASARKQLKASTDALMARLEEVKR